MTLRAFIFDLDGVLTDSAEYHYRAWKRLADEHGIPFSRMDNEALRGVSRRESLTLLLKGRSISEETAQEWMERKNNYYIEFIQQMTPADLLPGAYQLLKEIRQAGFKIAIASASKNAGDVIDRIRLRGAIDLLCDGYSVTETKPSPELFLYAAQKLGFPPSECVVVEDAAAPKGKKALAQTSAEGPSPLFNLCIAEKTSFADIDMTVALKAVAGKLDQGGGLVWRYRDENNYYLVRANAL